MKPGLKLALLGIVVFLLAITSIRAQQRNAVPGKLIIQFTPGELVDHKDFSHLYSYANLILDRCLSEDLGIWLCSYDAAADGDGLLRTLRDESLIAQAQYDHYISLRDTLADDPSFDMQWALYNIGQTGGLPDADIDATKAWEISVNEGRTLFGDSIVMAVVDDGFDLEHEDMNFWKNHNEIPANGIDDDGNGYIDDYDGWNAYAATGDIPERSHGTRVAGVAGAIGNNGIGISGVGWNCKVLPISGSSTFESTVVAALAYVYDMRSLYDETNGAIGAFIVVCNGSFGVDFADPENYPIWAMMYDSLGSLGILNSAATMNHESNVEIVGDVPTNFDSDYIIGVTNTTKNDVKYEVAAWGPISIDIGAPGSNIISTKTNNTYGYSTGTSLAAPQLSGSIALAYAAADEQFLQQYEEHPGETALFLKNIILDNVDTLSGFDTLCVSGGRLNLDQAVSALLSPRIEISVDTLSIELGQDTTASKLALLSNLTGFELAYSCSLPSQAEWIDYYPATGFIPEYSQENLSIGFRTDGLSFGTYYNQLEIRDPGGWLVPLVLELNIVPDLGMNETVYSSVVLKAYPNPFADNLWLNVQVKKASILKFNIYTLSGKLLGSFDEYLSAGKHVVEWDGGSSPYGVYVIEVMGEDYREQIKVIKTSR